MVYSFPMVCYSVYLHIPFYQHRCAYCDFNTYAGQEALIPAYTSALVREVQLLSASAIFRIPVHTIFFGGGTPSLLPAGELEKIINAIRQSFDLQPEAEVTLEANPGTLSAEYLNSLRSLGVNRLSLGVQSTSPEELHLLERQHTPEDVLQAVRWARQAGFDNLNLDLIYGLPFQTIQAWKHSLKLALTLSPEHFSLYALTLEHGTPMQNWVTRGLLPEPDEDLAAEMYEIAAEKLTTEGYVQYEISNWARRKSASAPISIQRPGESGPHHLDEEIASCRHNLQYWRNQPYLGFGAGAHGYVPQSSQPKPGTFRGVRTVNVLAPKAYIERCQGGDRLPFPRTPATVETNLIDLEQEIAETMMMGLRLVQEGISEKHFMERFNLSLRGRFGKEIRGLVQKGLLEWYKENSGGIRLTPKGRLLGNQVFMEFI